MCVGWQTELAQVSCQLGDIHGQIMMEISMENAVPALRFPILACPRGSICTKNFMVSLPILFPSLLIHSFSTLAKTMRLVYAICYIVLNAAMDSSFLPERRVLAKHYY